jgi:hypothetical protein
VELSVIFDKSSSKYIENTTTEADKNLDIWIYKQAQYVAGIN